MNKICSKCQTENLDTSKFCKKCGSPLSTAQSASPVQSKELSDIEKRVAEEKLYEQVAMDLKNGIRKEGLYAKALVDANGSVELANAIYIKYAVQSLQDELLLDAEQEKTLYEKAYKKVQEEKERALQEEKNREKIRQEEQINKERQLNDQPKLIKPIIEPTIKPDPEAESWGSAMIILLLVFLGMIFLAIVVASQ